MDNDENPPKPEVYTGSLLILSGIDYPNKSNLLNPISHIIIPLKIWSMRWNSYSSLFKKYIKWVINSLKM